MKRNSQTGICKGCNKEFLKKSVNNIFCTNECRDQYLLLESIRTKEVPRNARNIIFERDGYKCAYCGRTPIEHNVVLHVDHILPYTENNTNVYNLITSCKECNTGKGRALLPIDTYNRILKITIERNKGISPESRVFIEQILTEFYKEMKTNKK
jgi:hypothetical protein